MLWFAAADKMIRHSQALVVQQESHEQLVGPLAHSKRGR
jgi:hypothetical protein